MQEAGDNIPVSQWGKEKEGLKGRSQASNSMQEGL